MPKKQTGAGLAGRQRPSARKRANAQIDDRAAVAGDLVRLIWQHRLWWVVPLLLALIVLSVLMALEATPVGPLIYPLF